MSVMRVLVAAEGSGGHVIPALELSRALASRQAAVRLLYAQRRQLGSLMPQVMEGIPAGSLEAYPVAVKAPQAGAARELSRLWQTGVVWRVAHRHLSAFRPHVVAGFGGWFCLPVMLAARQRGISTLLHEQNVALGRANRLLSHWVDTCAVSFEATVRELNGSPRVVTGLPVRQAIGTVRREEAAPRLGLEPDRRTVLILGGSQGSRTLNRLALEMLGGLTEAERLRWQVIHLTGAAKADMRQAYGSAGLKALVLPHLADMAGAYALADVVITRAGASTIAELARAGLPAILIPYPYAGGHQRENAKLVESIGAGVWFEESVLTPARLLDAVRHILADERVRRMMVDAIRTLAVPDAAQRLASTVLALATAHVRGVRIRS